jgi:hypothetical protein
MRHEVATRRVLYEIPGMESVRVERSTFPGANGEPLPLEIYEATHPLGDCVVALVEGVPDAGFEKHVGCKFMEMEWTIDMARLIAASGMTAITHSNREAEPDAIALMKHFGAKYRKVGMWSTSGNGPVALVAASHAAAAVLNNPITKDFCPDTPLFIIRAGRDETPGLNAALDAFTAKAILENKPLTLVNFPDAPHSFELALDVPETRRILQQGLDFLRAHLV